MDSQHQIHILYVDDEANNLIAFKSTFRRKYTVFTAISASEGMKILHENEIHILIVDQRMPRTTGVEFLDIIRTAFPEPIRILLTGYSDIEAVIEAINKGEIYRYIKKPWDENELHATIQNAYEIYCTRRELKNKVAELEKTNDELNRFIYSISHDLRSPLSSVLGVLNLANMDKSIEDPNGYMDMIEVCIKRMDAFILKVIEYYKSIRVESEIVNISFEEMLKESIEAFKLQNPNIDYSLNISQPVHFVADKFRLSVILDNLISNAVKYQKPNESNPIIRLNVDVNPANAIIRIEDNGMGILQDHLKKVFRIFFRSDYSISGLGIGLYIVKEALHRLGGDITVESKYGEGTVFTVTVPNKLNAAEQNNLSASAV